MNDKWTLKLDWILMLVKSPWFQFTIAHIHEVWHIDLVNKTIVSWLIFEIQFLVTIFNLQKLIFYCFSFLSFLFTSWAYEGRVCNLHWYWRSSSLWKSWLAHCFYSTSTWEFVLLVYCSLLISRDPKIRWKSYCLWWGWVGKALHSYNRYHLEM